MDSFLRFVFDSMLKYALYSLPFFLLIRAVVFIKRKKINLLHEAAFLLFIVCLSAVMPIALIIPMRTFQTGEFDYSAFNFVPGMVFYNTYIDITEKGKWFSLFVNFFGNIAGFMPLGFFPALLWRGGSLKRALLIGFSSSLFIEVWQIFIPRTTDIDDILLNTLGALLGYLVWKLLGKRFDLNKFFV